MNIAIITGASSGLGRAYARLLDAEYLDEIWLIARREERLQELAQELRTSCRIFACDLTQPGVPAILQASLGERPDTEVRWLINAAGFGRLGYTTEIPLAEQLAMIDLNVKATVALTQLAIPFMSAGSHIMEIVSCSAFQPIPGLNVYAATKAFLLRYSRALGAELAPQGIIVSATRNSSPSPVPRTPITSSGASPSPPPARKSPAAPSAPPRITSRSAPPTPSPSSTVSSAPSFPTSSSWPPAPSSTACISNAN